jgi:hypothetical protein
MNPIRSTDRVAFVGKTGSGKTYAARILTKDLRRLVVFDPKGTLAGKWGLLEWNNRNAKRLKKGDNLRLRIPAPLDGNWEPYFMACYDCHNLTVYIDEMYGVISRGKPGQYLTALYTRGRELNIGVWASTQRPAWVPLFMLSEADWIFLFRLQLETDRKRVAEIMGDNVRDSVLTGHQVWVYNQAWDRPILYPRIASGKALTSDI